MSAYNRVIWSDGLFLQPQHFQQQDRAFERYIESRCHALTPFSWGLTDIEFESDLLRIGKIGLRETFFLHVLQRLVGFFDQFRLPLQQLLPEIFLLHRVHERLSFHRPVILRQRNRHRRQLHSQRLLVHRGDGGPLRRAEYRDGPLHRKKVQWR